MDILTKLQEKYIEEFSNNVPIEEFLVNVAVVTGLSLLVGGFYVKYGHAISNRKKFSENFLPLGLGTMLIITVVKSSVALSLGLVGALSIVRFRAAIKEPEELTFLFLIIGIGLACGANQPLLAIVAILLILTILLLKRKWKEKKESQFDKKLILNLQTDITDITKITATLEKSVNFLELRRMDSNAAGLDLSFVFLIDNLENLAQTQTALMALSPATRFTIIDYPEI